MEWRNSWRTGAKDRITGSRILHLNSHSPVDLRRGIAPVIDSSTCEHVLAALLAEALGTARQVPIDDVDFAEHS
ncbi:hypothetical protein CPB97_005901 [Podila verticillata]|nr:hypothetical protein CPB97_005901 [Podila verticillata]